MYADRTLADQVACARSPEERPSAELKMRIDNPAVQLEVGKFYYLDFAPAD